MFSYLVLFISRTTHTLFVPLYDCTIVEPSLPCLIQKCTEVANGENFILEHKYCNDIPTKFHKGNVYPLDMCKKLTLKIDSTNLALISGSSVMQIWFHLILATIRIRDVSTHLFILCSLH